MCGAPTVLCINHDCSWAGESIPDRDKLSRFRHNGVTSALLVGEKAASTAGVPEHIPSVSACKPLYVDRKYKQTND